MLVGKKLRNLQYFVFLSLIFLFLPSFYIPSTNIPIYDIVIGFCIITFLFLSPKYVIKQIIKLKTYRYFRFLIYFIIWVFLIGFIFLILGRYSFSHFLYASCLLFFYNDFLWYIYPILIFPRIFSLKFLIKFIFMGIYILCIYGLLVYCENLLGLNIINHIQDIINNRREEIVSIRVLSVFEEPSIMGCFLCVNLSMLYCLINSKYKIFKNSLLNILIKKTYIPILLLTIVLVQSPIWLIFFLIVTFIHYLPKIIQVMKYLIIICVFAIFGGICILQNSQIDVSDTFLNRIVIVYNTFTNWDDFVREEPSLANRLLSYYLRIKLMQKYPLTGVGYKNTEYNLYDIINSLNLTFTGETMGVVSESSGKHGYIRINGSIFWILLSDTGLIGTLLYMLFVLLSIKKLNQIKRDMPNSLEKDFVTGIRNFGISIICLSIYDTSLNFIFYWFMLGITNVLVVSYKQRIILYDRSNKEIGTK